MHTTATLAQLSANGEAALAARSLLPRGVLALPAGKKAPPDKDWVKRDAWEASEIRARWLAEPDANVGLRLGAGVICIDVDGHAGFVNFHKLEDKLGGAPRTLTTVTPGKIVDGVRTGEGLHRFFRVSDSTKIANLNGVFGVDELDLVGGSNIDIKSDGGYVVCAPSVHPDGGNYRWSDLTTPIATLTEQWERALLRCGKAPPTVEQTVKKAAGYPPTLELCCAFLGTVPVGRRNATLAAVAFKAGAKRWEGAAEALRAAIAGWDPAARSKHYATIDRQIAMGAAFAAIGPLTDSGNAERLIQNQGSILRFVTDWGKWITWTGSLWTADGAAHAVSLGAKNCARQLTDQPGVESFAKKSESRGSREATVALATTEPGIAIQQKALDADEWVLNAPNGLIDLRTGLLRPHNPNALCTKIAGAEFDPSAKAPAWEKFLSEVMAGDEEMVAFLRRAAGYSATGSVSEHKLFFLIGAGRNGKGVFLETLYAALGDYAAPVNPALLLASGSGERHPTEIATLHKLRLAGFSEIDEGRRWNEALLKRLTGGDTLSARRMREDEWTFKPTHKAWVQSNTAPEVRGGDDGIWSRFLRIPFAVSFLGREDKQLRSRLLGELPGILAWIVRGATEWRAMGLLVPVAVTQETQTYREQQDVLGQFLLEASFATKLAGEHSRSHVRVIYETWCRANGAYALPNRSFNEALRARGAVPVKPKRWASSGSSNIEEGWQFNPPNLH